MKIREFIALDTINQIEIYEGSGCEELLAKGFAHEIEREDEDLLEYEIATIVIDPSNNGSFIIRLEEGQTKKMFVRMRKTSKDIRLESIHRDEDHTNTEEWGVINMLSEKQFSELPSDKIESNIKIMEEKKEKLIESGYYQEYPF